MTDTVSTGALGFEDFGQDNGVRYWFARDVMQFLGYGDFVVFRKAINKAMAACAALNIPINENFIESDRVIKGSSVPDFKLSRFACYLSAMNADPRKPQVAAAQAYFAGLATVLQEYVRSSESIERVIIRDKISDQERSLVGVAHQAGVENYPFFQNAGYRGMYNMNLAELKAIKGVKPDKSLLDFMGRRELAANLFRISETEATIKNENVRGQRPLESTAERVGKRVRGVMIQSTGDNPEHLPIAEDIANVRKRLKTAHREFKQIDKDKKARRKDS